MTHPTDSYEPKNLSRCIVRKWIHGNLELYILKFYPHGNKTTTFRIIGRADPSHPYEINGKESDFFIDLNQKFDELIKKTKKRFKIKD